MAEKGVDAAFADNSYLDVAFGSPGVGGLTEFDYVNLDWDIQQLTYTLGRSYNQRSGIQL